MRVIIAGSREIKDAMTILWAIEHSGFEITEVVSGTAQGVDQLGEMWAQTHDVPVKKFPADWSSGKQGGYLRNLEMAGYADALIAIWDGKSKGTRHMIDIANNAGLKVFIYQVGQKGLFS